MCIGLQTFLHPVYSLIKGEETQKWTVKISECELISEWIYSKLDLYYLQAFIHEKNVLNLIYFVPFLCQKKGEFH